MPVFLAASKAWFVHILPEHAVGLQNAYLAYTLVFISFLSEIPPNLYQKKAATEK